MSRFTVVWSPSCQNQLLNYWLDRSDLRPAITLAADSIDKLLGKDPNGIGRPIEGSLRQLVVRPLAIAYIVSDDDRLVTVYEVHLFVDE